MLTVISLARGKKVDNVARMLLKEVRERLRDEGERGKR